MYIIHEQDLHSSLLNVTLVSHLRLMNIDRLKFSWEGLYYKEENDPSSIADSIRSFIKAEQVASKAMNRRVWSIKMDDAGRRRITHWVRQGLLNENRTGKKGWRKYSFAELMWLKIVENLRSSGFSLDVIKVVKESLCNISDTGDSEYPVLEYAFYSAYHWHDATYLVLLPGGRTELVYADELAFSIQMPHLHLSRFLHLISVNGLVLSLFPEAPMYLRSPQALSGDKEELLSFIDQNDFKEISFDLKGKKVTMMRGVLQIEGESISNKDISELRRKAAYQDITITQHDHRIKKVQATIKKKASD